MQAPTQTEQLPRDYEAWHDDFEFSRQQHGGARAWPNQNVIASLRQNSRTIGLVVAGLCALFLFGYCFTKNPTQSVPSSSSKASADQSLDRSASADVKALRAALTEQISTNQMLISAIDALRSEQQEMRKQIAALRAGRQYPETTGSVSPQPQTKAAAPKKIEQAEANAVPYPAPPRQIPYPPPAKLGPSSRSN